MSIKVARTLLELALSSKGGEVFSVKVGVWLSSAL